MNFKSDNIVGVHPQIMAAMAAANSGVEPSYGNDSYSKALTAALSQLFAKDVAVYLCSTGTAANSLSLAALNPPYGAIYCPGGAHVNCDEAAAPEFFTGGSKLITATGAAGKLDLDILAEQLAHARALAPHMSKPTGITISQASEVGTVYRPDELQEIGAFAEEHGLSFHMDGARFANSVAFLGATPAELTWKAGVDILSFGATKNGALAAEAVVIFNERYREDFAHRHKRAGQLFSKSRYVASQFLAYLEDELWLHNARHANSAARELAKIFKLHKATLEYPVEANAVFVRLAAGQARHLAQAGVGFYEWGPPGCGLYRFVCSCFTSQEELAALRTCLAAYRP